MNRYNGKLATSLIMLSIMSMNLTQASILELTDEEMDNVTAGYVNLALDANAYAEGISPSVTADTYTETNEYHVNGWEFSYGSGYGVASACCGNSTTHVNGNAEADGDAVLTFSSSTDIQSNNASYSTLWLGIFSVTMPNNSPVNNVSDYLP